MKKKIVGLFLALAFLFQSSVRADGLMLNGVTTTGASAAVLGSAQDVYAIDAQIWSSAGSEATVVIECRSYTTAPWWPCQTITNPNSTGVYYTLPMAFQYRLNVTNWVSGTIYGTIVVYMK